MERTVPVIQSWLLYEYESPAIRVSLLILSAAVCWSDSALDFKKHCFMSEGFDLVIVRCWSWGDWNVCGNNSGVAVLFFIYRYTLGDITGLQATRGWRDLESYDMLKHVDENWICAFYYDIDSVPTDGWHKLQADPTHITFLRTGVRAFIKNHYLA
jgi:hypothetical protein